MVTFGYFYRSFTFGKSFRKIIGYIAVGSLLHENILFQGEIRPRTELIPFRKFIIRSWWTVAVHRNPLDFFFSSPLQFSERTVAYTGRNSFYVFRHLCKRRGGIKSPHLAGIIPSSYIPLHPLSPRFLIATIRRKGERAEV